MNEPIDVNDVLIRPAVLSDAAASDATQITRIYNHYVDVGGATFDKVHWSVERVTKLLEIPLPDGCYVAELAGQLLGWASARQFSDRHGFRFSCETAIYLDPSAVGKKVADASAETDHDPLPKNEFHHAVAKIIASNDRSLKFHYRFGYELVGIQKEIGRVNDEWVDVAILQKVFS